jgi:hypothetical protein
MTFGLMTLGIMGLTVTLSLKDAQHDDNHQNQQMALCSYTECRYGVFKLCGVMLNVTPSVVMVFGVIMLTVMLSAIIQTVPRSMIMLSVIMLTVRLSVVMLSISTRSFVLVILMLSIIMLTVTLRVILLNVILPSFLYSYLQGTLTEVEG